MALLHSLGNKVLTTSQRTASVQPVPARLAVSGRVQRCIQQQELSPLTWGSHPIVARQPQSVVVHGQPGVLALPLDKPLDEPLEGFDSIKDALEDLAAGKFLVVLDDENRENEGDLIIAADKVRTPPQPVLSSKLDAWHVQGQLHAPIRHGLCMHPSSARS